MKIARLCVKTTIKTQIVCIWFHFNNANEYHITWKLLVQCELVSSVLLGIFLSHFIFSCLCINIFIYIFICELANFIATCQTFLHLYELSTAKVHKYHFIIHWIVSFYKYYRKTYGNSVLIAFSFDHNLMYFM